MSKADEAPRLLFIASDAAVFVSHRINLAVAAVAAGYQVGVASPPGAQPGLAKIAESGAAFIPIELERGSRAPLAELRSLFSIARAVRRFRPDLIHCITPKPVLYGGLVARMLGIPSIAAVTGLGHAFVTETPRGRALRAAVLVAYRLAINARDCHVIFQNSDDRELFRSRGALHHNRVIRIPGSGTDLTTIVASPLPAGPAVVVLPARLIRDKGIGEFVEAARSLRAAGTGARFRLLGDPDASNPTAISQQEIQAWAAEGVIEWRPHAADISAALAECHIIALPSYREGFPKTLIDAAAAGRPAVATDVPGCRDAIVDGVTGLLCAPRSGESLAATLATLINDRDRQIAMGAAARRHAEEHFGHAPVTAAHLDLYASALERRRSRRQAKVSGRSGQ